MSDRIRTIMRLLAMFAVLAEAGCKQAKPTNIAVPDPPKSTSAYQNTGPDVPYVGVNACKECHAENHRTYLHTAHSRALSDLDPKAEPPDGSFVHKLSGRSYRIYRKGDEFRHEELVRSADGKEIAKLDLPVRYLIGSGRFSRSYLVEVDGFLYESPITWYSSKKRWDMSPGYDFPKHWGFERGILVGCISCHAGRVAAEGESFHRIKVLEQAIGCESCHGPGGLHVAARRGGTLPGGTDDLTIVNPGKLPRPLLESVCASCHQNGPAGTIVRGRNMSDFRPGLPLTDFRIDYRFDSGNEQMTVVGHVDQLRRSKCYQNSPQMSCLTCHDPHEKELPKDSVAFYRKKCLDCHAEKGCRLNLADRQKKSPHDNCSACHMPRGGTDIPHIAFTHHRIGIHTPQTAEKTGEVPELVPIDSDAHLSEIDRKRNLGLAYLDLHLPDQSESGIAFRSRARMHLEEVYAANLRDGLVLEGLGRIYFREQLYDRAAEFAKRAIDADDLPPLERATALNILASCYMMNGKYPAAAELLEKLTRIRRISDDWQLLGRCYSAQNRTQDAVKALEQAVAIQPLRAKIYEELAEAYQRSGNWARADENREKARLLAK